MKYIFALSLSLFIAANVAAQKKPAASGTNKPTATTAAQQTGTAKNGQATQTVFMATGSPESFRKLTGDARSQYDAGKLDDSRFALQQMLAELDMIIGKEVLKALPTTMMDKTAVTKQDNVSGASGFFGVIIHREYGKEYNSTDTADNKNINVEIISNSPLITSINALLSLPLIGNTGDNQVIKINGYKALITKVQQNENQTNYEVQLPMGNSLISLKAPGYTQEQVAQMANSLPIPEIAKMLQ